MPAAQGGHTRAVYSLIRDGKFAEAAGILQGVLQVSPGSRAALSLLAYCYYQQEHFEAAAQTYEELAQHYSHVPEYQLYWAQSLCKAGMYAEASRAAAGIEGLQQAVRQLQCAIRYEAGDLRSCRKALEAVGLSNPAAAAANAGCLLYKEGRWAEAQAQFGEAAQMAGYSPELAYSVAACQYQRRDYAAALASLADIVELGVRQHPELGIGTQTEGMEARSVGNSAKLKQTALVEAFNLRAAVELQLVNPAGAAAALSDMPPRQEHELDPVTLHNQALVSLARAEQSSGIGGHSTMAAAAAGMDKLVHLLQHPPFPPELVSNLLSLCCRPAGDVQGVCSSSSSAGDGSLNAVGAKAAAVRAQLAERVLQEHAALVAQHVPPELLPLYEACVARGRSAEEAHARLDALAGVHVEGLRKRVKAVQDARWAGDQAAAAAGLEEYEQALEAFIPVLMSLVHLHWEAGAYVRAQEVLQQSAEFCADHPVWRLNLGHTLVAQEGGRLAEAAELYESLVQHFAGGGGGSRNSPQGPMATTAAGAIGGASGGSLLEVPPSALANLCVCHVVGSQNEVAEELLRRLEDETAAAAAAGQAPTPHLSLTNLAIGTLYCARGNFEFGLTRVMRALEPLSTTLDAQRWHGAMLCLTAMLDQVAKNMLVLKDAQAADLLAFLEDVEAAGKGWPALGGGGQTVCSQARSLRAMLLKMSD